MSPLTPQIGSISLAEQPQWALQEATRSGRNCRWNELQNERASVVTRGEGPYVHIASTQTSWTVAGAVITWLDTPGLPDRRVTCLGSAKIARFDFSNGECTWFLYVVKLFHIHVGNYTVCHVRYIIKHISIRLLLHSVLG